MLVPRRFIHMATANSGGYANPVVVGGIIGGIVLILILIALYFWWRKRRNAKVAPNQAGGKRPWTRPAYSQITYDGGRYGDTAPMMPPNAYMGEAYGDGGYRNGGYGEGGYGNNTGFVNSGSSMTGRSMDHAGSDPIY
jgi:hypothetical protein